MEEHKKANLFVVGAMRAGTTSFAAVLSEHPDIYVSPIKEPHYFLPELPKAVYSPSHYFSLTDYFRKDFPKEFHIADVNTLAQYKKLFSLAGHQKYLAEASTCYLSAPNVAEAIKTYNQEARIIVLVREPLARAYSHYAMDVALGREQHSFEIAMQKELTLLEKGELPWYSRIGMSCYDSAIANYQRHFSTVCIIELEHLIESPKETFKKVADFLEIDLFPDLTFPKKNEAVHMRNSSIVYFLSNLGVRDQISKVLGTRAKKAILKVSSTTKPSGNKLSDRTKERLLAVFQKLSTGY